MAPPISKRERREITNTRESSKAVEAAKPPVAPAKVTVKPPVESVKPEVAKSQVSTTTEATKPPVSRTAEAAAAPESESEVETAPKKSWREKFNERKQKRQEEAAKNGTAQAAEGEAEPLDMSAPAATEDENKENEDVHGTKKLRSDFDDMMKGMEAEMEAGRGKLAKLRERIRRAKGAIKNADEAIANSTQQG